MKRIGFFAAIGIFIFVSCKKETFEPVTQKEKNDTIVTNPPYWCVKSAELKRTYGTTERFVFEYDANSLLKVAKVYYGKDTFPTNTYSFTYEGRNMANKKFLNIYSETREETRTYVDGKIKTINILGYRFSELINSTSTSYEYDNNAIRTETIFINDFSRVADTIYTILRYYPDSSTAETGYIWSQKLSIFKEKLIKPNNAINLSGHFFSDSVFIGDQRNLFNPLIWDLFSLDYVYSTYFSYPMKSVLLRKENNPYFVQNTMYSNTYQNPRNYTYDNEGRLTMLTIGTKQSFHGEEPAFPTELTLTY